MRALPLRLIAVLCLLCIPASQISAQQRADFSGHEMGISQVAFAPDGSAVASAGFDHSVRIWPLAPGTAGKTSTGHGAWVRALAFAPDKQTIASADDDGFVQLWDAATLQSRAHWKAHDRGTLSIAFSSDGQLLATGGADGTIKLWEMPAAKLHATLSAHSRPVLRLAFSRDGSTLASASADRTAILWEVAAGKPRKTLGDQGEIVFDLAFSPDGKRLATVSDAVRLWDAATGLPLKVQFDVVRESVKEPGSFVEHLKPLQMRSVAWSPGDKFLATGDAQGAIKLWDIATGKQHGVVGNHRGAVASLAFAPDGESLVSGGGDMLVKVWFIDAVRQAGGFPNLDKSIFYLVPSGDGKTLFTASGEPRIRRWDATTWKELPALYDKRDSVWQLLVDRKTNHLLSIDSKSGVIVWDATAGKPLNHFVAGKDGSLYAAALSPDGQTLATAGERRPIEFWDVSSGKKTGELPNPVIEIRRLDFSPDGKWLAAARAGHATVSIVFDDKGDSKFAPGKEEVEDDIWIWELPDKKLHGHWKTGADGQHVLCFSPDSQVLATNGKSSDIELFDPATGAKRATLSGHLNTVYALQFSPNGQTLAAAGTGKVIEVWNVPDRRLRAAIDTSIELTNSLTFAPDNVTLFTSGGRQYTAEGGEIRAWDLSKLLKPR